MIRLQLTSGRGPAECRIALGKFLEAIIDEAEQNDLSCDVVLGASPDKHGPGSALIFIDGHGADQFATNWIGTLLWICPSPVRPSHRRKNWFVGCRRIDPPSGVPSEVEPSDVRFEAFRAGGPGGQHQNTTESAVRAVHEPTGATVVVRDERSQHRNKAVALQRLAELLESAKDLAKATDRNQLQAAHDQLERGKPVRMFRGPRFQPIRQ